MNDDLARMFRMPVSFGPAPGPRNLPEQHRHRRYEKNALTLTLSARTDADALADLLPPGFTIEEPARIEVSLIVLTDYRLARRARVQHRDNPHTGTLAGRGASLGLLRTGGVGKPGRTHPHRTR